MKNLGPCNRIYCPSLNNTGIFFSTGRSIEWTFYLSCSSDSSPYPELDHEECLLSFPTCPESSNLSCEQPVESYGEEPLSGCKSPLASLVSGVLYSHTCLHSIFSNFKLKFIYLWLNSSYQLAWKPHLPPVIFHLGSVHMVYTSLKVPVVPLTSD